PTDDDGPTPTDADDPTPTDQPEDPTPTADEPPGDDPDEQHFLGEWMTWSESYVMEMAFDDPETGDSGTMIMRIDGDSSHWRVETEEEGVSEMYAIEGDTYIVSDGECLLTSGGNEPSEEFDYGSDPDTYEEEASSYPDLEPAGDDTIDGEAMYVYEVTATETDDFESATYYVSQDSGYLRRVETETGTVDLHSWGSVEPIEPPDMECESFGSDE
ncbi:MAG: hypothetical protein ACLFMX_06515, partial [Halobacteriales archaeon]